MVTNNRLENYRDLHFTSEILGLKPLGLRLRQAFLALAGDKDVPRSKFGLSSLRQLYPGISPVLWKGKYYIDRKVIISNLYNHTPVPIEYGWSVRKRQVLDFRGKKLTYDSHNATDFAVPVGSKVLAAAPGEVVAILSEFNRGGLKLFIDHGYGIMTSYVHLARTLVKVGDQVSRFQLIAISGYSGLDGLLTYPFGIPHVHFNVWLNGEPVDPFPTGTNSSMWLDETVPGFSDRNDLAFVPSVFKEDQVNDAVNKVKNPKIKNWLFSMENIRQRAIHTIIQQNYYPTRFENRWNLYEQRFERIPILSLPFCRTEFDGVVFLDDLLEESRNKRRLRQ